VAIGDDTTDEDAFRAAQALGGVGMRIGAVETAARFSFADIATFHGWLLHSVRTGILDFERVN